MQTIDDAWAALRDGNRVRAELVATQLADSARANHGPDTPGHARALGDLAAVLVATGDLPRAVGLLRRAASIEGVDELSTRAQLSHATNLGEIMLALGHADEAVAVLEGGLERRRGFFGSRHPGVAAGLEPLADAELARGRPEHASAYIDEAVSILEHHADPRVADARVVRAEVRASLGEEALFADEEIDPVDDSQLRSMVATALWRADRTRAPERTATVVAALRDQLLRRFGPCDDDLRAVHTTLANLHRLAGDAAARIEALVAVQALLDQRGELDAAHEVTLGLALAASEAERSLEAEAHYRDALARLDRLADADAARSRTLRDLGLFLAARDRFDEAEPMLLAATDAADPVVRGRAHTALGVTLQHRGEVVRARTELERALATVPPEASDAVVARRHLAAIDEGTACGCVAGTEGLVRALSAIVQRELPEGLLDRLDVDAQGQLQVHLLREASDDEREHLWRVLRQGIVTLRQGVRGER